MASKRLLIVEDERIVAEQLRQSLASQGYDVVGVSYSGEDAVLECERSRPDLVVMDIVLPGELDGIGAAQKLQALGIPVIYLTAWSDAHLLTRAHHTEPLAYVMKPAGTGELAAVTQLALFKREQEHPREVNPIVGGKEADEQFRLMVAGITDHAIFTLDTSGNINSWNRGAERITGYSVHEMIGQSFAILFTPEDRNLRIPEKELEQARQTGSAEDTRWLVRHNGERFRAEGTLTAIRDSEGVLTGFAKITRDSTARKQVEETLHATQERLHLALQAARTGTWEWNIRNDTVILDDSLRALFELRPDQEVKIIEDFYAVIHPDDRPKIMAECERTRNDGVHLDTEFRVIRPDGTERWLMDQGGVEIDEHGHAVRMSGACVDITARKQAETELRRSEERFRLFVNNVRDYALFQLDTDARIVTWNAGAERVLGYSELEVIGRHVSIIFVQEDISNGEAAREIHRAATLGRSEDERWHVRKDGTRLWCSGVLTAMLDEKGQLRGFAMVMRDETERRQASEKLSASVKEKEILVQEIHHRVKNNLQVITSLLTLQAESMHGASVRAAFEDACNRVRSIAGIHELLYRWPDLEHIDFKGYLDRLAQNLVSFYPVDPDQVGVIVDATEARLELAEAVPCGLIVNELLTNSLKHAFPATLPSDRPRRIQISLACQEQHCVLDVSDNGVGLPAGFNVEKTSSLGLKLVSVLTRQLQGTMKLESQQGTRVAIEFRLSKRSAAAEAWSKEQT